MFETLSSTDPSLFVFSCLRFASSYELLNTRKLLMMVYMLVWDHTIAGALQNELIRVLCSSPCCAANGRGVSVSKYTVLTKVFLLIYFFCLNAIEL